MNRPPHTGAPEQTAPAAGASAALRQRAERYTNEHAPRGPRAEAPDPGEVLGAVPRPDGTELRVSLHRFEGRPFLRIAPWQRGADGAWWPVKGKGCSVKVRELGAVGSALAAAMDALDAEGAR